MRSEATWTRFCWAVALLLLVLPNSVSAKAGVSVVDLNVDHVTAPLGIDQPRPLLSWRLDGTARGLRQTAYQIRVASSEAALKAGRADIWDSGKIVSDRSVDVPYAGPAPRSRQRFFWQVRVWDRTGRPTAYSPISRWEMGLLSPADWRAEWIAGADPLLEGDREAGAKWIWGPEPRHGVRRFRYAFDVRRVPSDATLMVSGKSTLRAWVNGKPLELRKPMTLWGSMETIDLTSHLRPGRNLLAFEVEAREREPNGGALAAIIRLQAADGSVTRYVTSGTGWKSAGEAPADWFRQSFDDRAWVSPIVVAAVGDAPFGHVWPARPAALLRREFQVDKPIAQARLYATALGSYRLSINGQRVGDEVLAPGWTDYRQHVRYQSFDVTDLLRRGDNAIGAMVGDGWYSSGLGLIGTHHRHQFGAPPNRLLAQLEVVYADGTSATIATDGQWRSAEAPIRFSEIYGGEFYDARLEQPGWDRPGFRAEGWWPVRRPQTAAIRLAAQSAPPIRVKDRLTAKTVTEFKPGVFIFDLGQNIAGWAKLSVEGPRGATVRLRFGERLKPNGELDTENLRTAQAMDSYVLKGQGHESYEPHFTYHGFRYVEVTGYPGRPPLDAIEGVVIHTDTPVVGHFESASELVDKIWHNTMWSQRANFMSVPTDCPQRDERFGWTGDAQVLWRAAAYNMDVAAFTRKFMDDLRDAQLPNGAFSDVAPRIVLQGGGTPGWGDAGVILPWTSWRHYGDTRIIDENWAAMSAWMRFIAKANPDHLWVNERGANFGDWLSPDSNNPRDETTPRDLIATAYWARDARMMADMALATGRTDEADEYERLHGKIAAAFAARFIRPDGTIGNGSQGSYAIALDFGLVPEALKSRAVAHLVADIERRGGHLSTGFLATRSLLPALSRNGRADVAYRLLMNRTYPSWGYMVEKGATTMWERWNSDTGNPQMNSFNHFAFGSVAEWLYREVAGIEELEPGFKRILFRPRPNAQLPSAKASFDSIYGTILSDWRMDASGFKLTVRVPPNTDGRVVLPTGPQNVVRLNGRRIATKPAVGEAGVFVDVPAGEHQFEVVQR